VLQSIVKAEKGDELGTARMTITTNVPLYAFPNDTCYRLNPE
jgi:hypothetical protein